MMLIVENGKANARTFTDQDGTLLYKLDTPWKKGLKLTTIVKVSEPKGGPVPETTIGEIKWHWIHHKIVFDGKEEDVGKFFPAHGISQSKRTFKGPDGTEYEWRVSKDCFSNELRIKDKDMLIAKSYPPKNLLKDSQRLEVHKEGDEILDLLITTFAFVDMERKSMLAATHNVPV